jgi:hypothetical protein
MNVTRDLPRAALPAVLLWLVSTAPAAAAEPGLAVREVCAGGYSRVVVRLSVTDEDSLAPGSFAPDQLRVVE